MAGLATAAVLLVLFIAAVVVSYILQGAEEEPDEANNNAQCLWRQKLSKVHRASLKAIPLSAVGIVVVVVQILTQVGVLMEDSNVAPDADTQQNFGAISVAKTTKAYPTALAMF